MRSGYDFSGWATRNDIKCSDGRTIRYGAFKDNDGQTVPLVWNHQHNDAMNVLGHALLEHRDQGVYAYCTFNDTEQGRNGRELVRNGDIKSLSIYANQLKQKGGDVLHGAIREVSLVLAGANQGAVIDNIISHGEESDEEAIIYTGDDFSIELFHAEEKPAEEKEDEPAEKETKMPESNKTVKEIFNSLNEEQKAVVYAMLGVAAKGVNEEEEPEMKHNVFENDMNEQGTFIAHSEIVEAIGDAKRMGSMKEAFLAHGIEDVDVLFPDAKNLDNPPAWIKREDSWVTKVMSSTHHTPFSRIKSMFADLTEDEARAKGYIKGKMKKDQVFSLLKRTTTPTTIYKKQKMDRDDVIDITDFDVIAWLKQEMRFMLNEEIARAILVGDGRLASSDDKIPEDHIRPIINDADLFVIRWGVAGADEDEKAKNFIKSCIRARKNYKGSGSPTLYTTEDMLTTMLLLEDTIGHKLYKTEADLATTLRVKEIVTVPVMEGVKDTDGNNVLGVIVNLADYNVGADKGGEVNFFDDFDIDYNAQKYLIETRCSGALTKPFAAISLVENSTTGSMEPDAVEAMDEFRKTKHNKPDQAEG